MEEITLKSTLQKAQFSELTDAERQLIDVAKESTFNSYAPYSHFHC